MTSRAKFVVKVFITLTTLLFLLSFGGMLAAGWVLVPLHWWAARDNGIYGTFGWGLLAALSTFEMGWMLVYWPTENAWAAIPVGIVTAAVTFAIFALRGSRRWVFGHSIVE
ncbi:MAG: hypothetical protein AB7L13_11210 [Acidimicrobiia bacterium]